MSHKILIVDDEPDIVKLLEARLEAASYNVISAVDGESALKQVKDARPDLIILDVLMPPPNGFQVCRTLKNDSSFKDIPIILLTAKSTESDQFWGMESGADAYVTKPYNPEDLLSKVRLLLHQKINR